MDEDLNRGLHLHFQVPEDSNSVWPYRETGGPTRLSTVLGYNHVGREVTSLDLSHSYHIRDIKGGRENHISFGKADTAGRNDNDDGTENETPCSNCKPNVGILPRGGDDSEIYVRSLTPLRESIQTGDARQHRLSNRVESKRDDDITMGFRFCPNSGTIRTLQASTGKLFRITTMGSVTWTKVVCRLILPHPDPARQIGRNFDDQEAVSILSNSSEYDVSQQSGNNSFMVVDTFASEQDRRRVALTFGYDLPVDSRDPKEFIESTDYLENVAEFGFNHIIIIGEIDYGMVFMDCFGRLFQWEDMCQRLWPSESDDGLPWFVGDDGNIYKHKPKKSKS